MPGRPMSKNIRWGRNVAVLANRRGAVFGRFHLVFLAFKKGPEVIAQAFVVIHDEKS